MLQCVATPHGHGAVNCSKWKSPTWGVNCSCTCDRVVNTVQRLASLPYPGQLNHTGFFIFYFSSLGTQGRPTRWHITLAVLENVRRYGEVFFMACGAEAPPNVTSLPCPTRLQKATTCWGLRMQEMRLAMLEQAVELGISDAIFFDLDMLWLSSPRVAFSTAVLTGCDIGLMYRGAQPKTRFATNLNGGLVYTRTTPAARQFWYDVVKYTRGDVKLSSWGGCSDDQKAMSVVAGRGKLNSLPYGTNHNVSNGVSIYIGHYHTFVTEPWLPDRTTGMKISESVKRSGTCTPCLSTLLTAGWGSPARAYSKRPPLVLHYKGWNHCPSGKAANLSFLNTAACIETARRTTPSRSLERLNPNLDPREGLPVHTRMQCGGA